MERYVPPFTITNQMLMLVAEIAEKTGSVSNFHSFEAKPHLRRNNRIRSIHSSLAIESNSFSLDEVRSVISGKTGIGPQKEIQEVKNAYQAYEQLGRFDPYSLEDLKGDRVAGLLWLPQPDRLDPGRQLCRGICARQRYPGQEHLMPFSSRTGKRGATGKGRIAASAASR